MTTHVRPARPPNLGYWLARRTWHWRSRSPVSVRTSAHFTGPISLQQGAARTLAGSPLPQAVEPMSGLVESTGGSD
jgi:hypothetical protein